MYFTSTYKFKNIEGALVHLVNPLFARTQQKSPIFPADVSGYIKCLIHLRKTANFRAFIHGSGLLYCLQVYIWSHTDWQFHNTKICNTSKRFIKL